MASLFKKKLLQEKVQNYTIADRENKIDIIKQRYHTYNTGNLAKKTESECEQAFNDDFFKQILWYSSFPTNPYTLNPKGKTDATGQKPDAILGYFDPEKDKQHSNTQVVVEIKDATTPLDKSQRREGNLSPIQQWFKYKPQYANCKRVIVSNFIEIRLFKDNQLDYEIRTLEQLLNPHNDYYNFKVFHYLLCADHLISKTTTSTTEKLLSDMRIEQEKITKAFYKEYRTLRHALIQDLSKRNPRISITTIVQKAQKIIDRLIFIHFCEDLGLLPQHKLKEYVHRAKEFDFTPWEIVKKVFKGVDEWSENLWIPDGYNGWLFHHDPQLDSLQVDDKLCQQFVDLGAYDFSEDLSVNILGHIFEQSISDLEEIRASLLQQIGSSKAEEAKQSKRKKDGIFYTPEYIVDYIVKNSLWTWLDEQFCILAEKNWLKEGIQDKNYQKRLQQTYHSYQQVLSHVKVLDPACGSGAFLVKVFDYLLEENVRVMNILAGSTWWLFDPYTLAKDILTNNIYGVDLNQESVEITKLSLWLKTAQKGKKLADLDSNIKCGNSLINDPAVAGDKAFDRNQEFAEIMNSWGFDIVVGNPPYLRIQGLKDAYPAQTKFYDENYQSATGNYDIYVLFMEKSYKLINKNGKVSFILPHKFLISEFGEGIRKFLSQTNAVQSLVHFQEHLVFEVTTYTCIITLTQSNNKKLFFKHINPFDIQNLFQRETTNTQRLWSEKRNLVSDQKLELFEKLCQQPHTCKDIFARIFTWLQTSADKIFLIEWEKKWNHIIWFSESLDEEVKIEEKFTKPVLKWEDVHKYKKPQNNHFVIFPYSIQWQEAKIIAEAEIASNYPLGYAYLKKNEKALRAREKGKFDHKHRYMFGRQQGINGVEQTKIITPEISLWTNMTFDDADMYHSTTAYSFVLKDANIEKYKFYLSILNSKLMRFWLENTWTILRWWYFRFKTKYLYPFPLPKEPKDISTYVLKADTMLSLNQQFHDLLSSTLDFLQQRFSLEKLSNKLQTFYQLDFQEFKKQLTIKKLSLTDEEDLLDYFTEKKQKLLEIQNHINTTDQQIDAMVYTLYGLTPEQIQIVEQSAQK